MRKILFSCFLMILSPQYVDARDRYLRNPHADVLHYEFTLRISNNTDSVYGKALINVKFRNEPENISFDLITINSAGKGMSVSGVTLNGKDLFWQHEENRLTISLESVTGIIDTLAFLIEYNGIPADGLIISKNKFGNRTIFADHWPDRAQNYLPCIDHPYDKASVDFIIIAPDPYKIIANGNLIEESDLPGEMTVTHWSEKVPIATKVMAFGAASFAIQSVGSVNDVPVWTWVFPENRNEGFFDYSVALKPLAYYSELIGDYPYGKLANVQSKTIYGGLENAGTIFYSERSVTGKGKAGRLIAHEIAHQWFGNSVTENDWHHIWLSEGFATYLTSMYFESFMGNERLKTDMISDREDVIKYHEKNKKPVIDTSVVDFMDLLNTNSYKKGAWVLHMLRHETGDEAFIKGLQLYYSQFSDSNAVTSDFQNVMESVSGLGLDKFFRQWLYMSGHPELKITVEKGKKKGEMDIHIEQKQENLFEFNLELLVKSSTGENLVKTFIDKKTTSISIPAAENIEIVPDPEVHLLFKKIF